MRVMTGVVVMNAVDEVLALRRVAVAQIIKLISFFTNKEI